MRCKKFFYLGFCCLSLFTGSCGMQLTIPHQDVMSYEIDSLENQGFTTVGAAKIRSMQDMKRPQGICKTKRNVCGMDAGVSAGFLLDPQEAFYDVNNPPYIIRFGDGTTAYDKIGQEYPIMRPKALRNVDVGVSPLTLAEFWSRSFSHHKAQFFGFADNGSFFKKAKEEIAAGRPVLVQVRVSAPGFPLYMPDKHLGPRGFYNAHWVVLIGFSDNEWLIRDNGGLAGTLDYSGRFSYLLKISHANLDRIANNASLSEDIKLYLDEPDLPIFLDDWDNTDNDEQLRRDFRTMQAYNLISFARK